MLRIFRGKPVQPVGGSPVSRDGRQMAVAELTLWYLGSAKVGWCWCISHRIHGTGIFTYIWLIFMVDVGKYSIYIEHLGYS